MKSNDQNDSNDAKDSKTPLDRLTDGYDVMLERVNDVMKDAEHKTSNRFREGMEHAREKAIELDELSREEAEKIGSYLERDLKDAARFLSDTGDEFKQWFKFDLELVESRMFEAFASVADKTRVELEQWSEWAREASRYTTGEVTGAGTLVCEACGKELHFHKAGHIPPCPACGKTHFCREMDSDNAPEENAPEGEE